MFHYVRRPSSLACLHEFAWFIKLDELYLDREDPWCCHFHGPRWTKRVFRPQHSQFLKLFWHFSRKRHIGPILDTTKTCHKYPCFRTTSLKFQQMTIICTCLRMCHIMISLKWVYFVVSTRGWCWYQLDIQHLGAR